MKNLNLDNKKLILVPFIALGLVFFSSAFAQTVSSDLPEGITQAQITSALEELSTVYGKPVENVDEARNICNSEQFLIRCAEIGKSHNLYKEGEVSQVNTLLNQIKGDVSTKLSQCATAECFLNVAKELAEKIVKENPRLATQLDLTSKKVEEKRAVVEAAKEAGVDFQACRNMDPDNAPVDLLRSCARLAKDARVGKFISEKAKEGIRSLDSTLVLRDSLDKKEFSCGDGTLEGCGDFCLNPATTARAQGVAAIPPVCKQIAEKFFGSEGIKSLEAAYQNVNSAVDYYNKKAQHTVFITQDGKTLTDPAEIGFYMETQGRLGNVDAVGKGLDFMVSNGFVSSEERDFALKMVGNFRNNKGGANIDFDMCQKNPEACADFIPEEFRSEFDSANKIKNIMSQKLGFDPRECDTSNESIRNRCFEAAKNALPELEALPTQSREVQRMIAEMREHTRQDQAFNESRQVIQQQGGPGGCKSPQECFAYCSDTAHGPECLSFGAKSGIFKGSDVIQRYREYNYRLEAPKFSGPQHGDFTETGPYPGFQPPGQEGYLPPGQIPGFTQPGPGFGGPAGPSPECFQAIQSGDFARAKEVCSVPSILKPIEFQPTICPSMPTVVECPADQVRYVTYSSSQCGEYYGCKSSSETQCPSGRWDGTKCVTYSTDPATGCAQAGGTWDAATNYCKMPGTANCPSGQYWDYNTQTCMGSTAGGTGCGSSTAQASQSACLAISGCRWDNNACSPSTFTPTACPSGQYWNGTTCVATTPYDCPLGQSWNGTTCVSSTTGGSGCGSYTNQTSCVGASSIHCDWRSSGSSGWCQASTGTASCGNYICESGETTSCSADCQGYTSAETCGNNYCGSGETSASCPSDCSSSTTTGSCPSGQYWYTPPSGGTGYCKSTETPCPSGQYWNGTACVTTTTHDCTSGQYWDTATSTCKSSTTTTCPSGYHMGMNNACEPDSATSTSSNCGTGMYWNGSACVSSTTTTPTTTACPSGYHMGMNNACEPDGTTSTSSNCGTGMYWNGSSCVSSTSTACGSGQYWDGTACVTSPSPSPSTTCGSGQYWNGTACVASTPPPTTDPATSCANSGGTWDGSTCKYPPPSTLNINFFLAQISQILKDLFNLIGNSGSVR